jgi:hypothetical protein
MKYESHERNSGGLWPDDTASLIFVQRVIYRLYRQMMGKIWVVFKGGTRVIDRFD